MSNNGRVSWSHVRKCFICNGKPLKGLHDTLKATFFPKYEYRMATLGATGKSKIKNKIKVKPRVLRFIRPEEKGKNLGSLVDEQMKSISRFIQQFKCSVAHFGSKPPTLPATLRTNPRALALYNNCYSTLHAFTKKVVAALIRRNLEIIDTQVAVMDPKLQIATAIDLLCINKAAADRPTVIEVKTGFAGYYDKHTRYPMSAPFEGFFDSPRNQHQLQLAFTHLMYCLTSSKQLKEVDALVIWVQEAGVSLIPLHDDIEQHIEAARGAIEKEKQIAQSTWVSQLHKARTTALKRKPSAKIKTKNPKQILTHKNQLLRKNLNTTTTKTPK